MLMYDISPIQLHTVSFEDPHATNVCLYPKEYRGKPFQQNFTRLYSNLFLKAVIFTVVTGGNLTFVID
jgi:hypothetical protein